MKLLYSRLFEATRTGSGNFQFTDATKDSGCSELLSEAEAEPEPSSEVNTERTHHHLACII